MANIPTNNVPRIYVPSLSVPKLKVPKLYVPRMETPGKGTYKKAERKHVKDLGDILLGDPISGTKQLQHTLQDNGYGYYREVPFINRILGLQLLWKERFFEPMSEGEYWVAGINTLETLGSSLDILANPVKALLPWAGGGSGEDFLRSMGWMEGEYRETYQWDTGNGIVDFVGEMFSDPVNWFSFGANGVVKSIIKNPDDMAKQVLKEMPDDIVRESTEQTTKNVVKTALKNNTELNEEFLRAYYKNSQAQYDELYNILKKELGDNRKLVQALKQNRSTLTPDIIKASPKTSRKYLLRRAEVEDLTHMFKMTKDLKARDDVLQAFTSMRNTKGYQTLQYWRKVHAGAKAIDNALLDIAIATTPPLGLMKALYKYGVDPIFNTVWKATVTKFKQVNLDNVLDIQETSAVAAKEIEHKVNAAYTKVTKDWNTFFKEFNTNLNTDVLRRMYRNIELNTNDADFSIELLNHKFYVELYEEIPELRYVADAPKEFKKFINTKDFGDLSAKWKHLRLEELTKYIATMELGLEFTQQLSKGAIQDGVMKRLYAYMLDVERRVLDKDTLKIVASDPVQTRYTTDVLDQIIAKETRDEVIESVKANKNIPELHDILKRGDVEHAYHELTLEAYNPKIVLDFLDDTLFYGNLNDMLNYLTDVRISNYEQYVGLMQALEPLGINANNINVLAPLIKKARTSTDPEAMDKLWAIMLDANLHTPLSDTSAKIAEATNTKQITKTLKNRNTQQKTIDLIEDLSHSVEDGFRLVDTHVKKPYNGPNTELVKPIDRIRRRNKLSIEPRKIVTKTKTEYDSNITELQEALTRVDSSLRLSDVEAAILSKRQTTLDKMAEAGVTNLGYGSIDTLDKPIKVIKQATEIEPKYPTIIETKKLPETDTDYAREIIVQRDMTLPEVLARNSVQANQVYYKGYKETILEELDSAFQSSTRPFMELLNKSHHITDFYPETMSPSEILYDFSNKLKHLQSTLSNEDIIKDMNKALAEIESFTYYINNLQTQVDRWLHTIKLERLETNGMSVKYSENLRSYLEELQATLNSYQMLEVDKIAQADWKVILQTMQDNNTSVYVLKRSNLWQTQYVWDALESQKCEDIVWQSLKSRDSKLRKNLRHIMYELQDKRGMQAYITDLKEILSTIDGEQVFGKWLSQLDAINENKNIQDWVVGMFHNLLYDRRLEKLAFKDSVDELVDSMMEQFDEQITGLGMRNLMLSYYDVDTIPNIVKTIEEQLESCLRGYLNDMLLVASENQLPVISVYKSISTNKIAERMLNLSDHYAYIMTNVLNKQSLLKGECGLKYVQSMSEAITAMSTNNINDQAKEIVQELLQKKLKIKDTRRVMDDLIHLQGSSIQAEIRNAFAQVNLENKVLRGAIAEGKDTGLLASIQYKKHKTEIDNRLGVMYGNQITALIQGYSDAFNIYDFSTMTDYGFERILTKEVQDMFRLYPTNFIDTADGVELVKVFKMAEEYKNLITNPLINKTDKQLEGIRKNLQRLVSSSNPNTQSAALIKDAAFFDECTPGELYFWDEVYSNSSINKDVAKRYKAIKKESNYHEFYQKTKDYTAKAKYHANPLSAIKEYEQTSGLIKAPKDLVHIQHKMDYEYFPIHKQMLTKDYESTIKDLDSLGRHKTDILEYTRRDVRALDELKNFDSFKHDERFLSELNLSKTDQADLQRHGIVTTYTKVKDTSVDRYLKAKRAEWVVDNVLKYSPTELRSFLDYENEGWFFISIPKGRDPKVLLRHTTQELKKAGVKINKVSELPGDVFFVYRTDNVKRARCHKFDIYTHTPKQVLGKEVYTQHSELQKLQDVYTNAFKNNYRYFHTDGMLIPPELMTGDLMSNDISQYLRSAKSLKKYFGDIDIQKTYSNLDELGNNKFYARNIPRPDLAFLGELNCYDQVMALAESSNIVAGIPRPDIPRTMSMANSATNGTIVATKMANTEHKFAQLIANEDFDIGNPMFKRVFENASSEEIKAFFEQKQFIPCVLREDPITKRPKIYRYSITNKAQVTEAIKDKVLILPYEIYRSSTLVFNKHKVDNKLINFYTDVIVKTYKSIWLSTPGFIMRNYLDSALYKNMSATDGVTSILENFRYEYKAAKMLDWYDDVYKTIRDTRVKFGGPALPNALYTKKVLQTMSESDQQMFLLMLAFERSGAASGLTETVEQAMIKYNKAMLNGGKEAVSDAISDLLYKATPTAWLNKVNDRVERVSRLGLLLNLIDHGADSANAFKKVIDTHFDYELAAAELGLLGDIFWFITFPIKNSLYYLNEGISKNPDMLKMQMDIMEQSWNTDELSWDDVKKSDYLARNAMTGNIRITFNGKDIVLKTGSSVLDFFKILFDPVGAAKDRLNPFLSVLLGQEDTSQLNPFASVSNRIDQIHAGRSLIPSVYTTLYDRNYKTRHYIAREPYIRKGKWYFKPRKNYFKKPDNMKRMRYKFATDRYYFNRGKNLHRWLSSTTSIEPHWYMNNYRYRRTQGKYNRAAKQLKRIR